MNGYYTLRPSDVGKPLLRIFGRVWLTSGWIGQVLPGDVGKRVYQRGGILQVENDEQVALRLDDFAAEPQSDEMAP